MAKTGRPSKFTKKIADEICERISCGESLLKICKASDMPSQSMFFRWLQKESYLREKYAHARLLQQDVYAQQIVDIADDATNEGAQVAKLQMDARKWHASKVAPKKWGNAADPANTITINTQKPVEEMTDDELDAYIAARQGT